MKDELNVDMNWCIVKRENIGNTEYINICTGETNKVDWGLKEWCTAGFVTILVILLIIIICGFIKFIKNAILDF